MRSQSLLEKKVLKGSVSKPQILRIIISGLLILAVILIYELTKPEKSTYFSDSYSKEILSGETIYDMSSFRLLCGPGSSAKTNEYGFKIINAFKQLGYFFAGPCGEKLNIHSENNIGIILLNAYQRDNGLSESNYVNKKILQKLDTQIKKSEKRDNLFAKEFRCYNTIKDAPPNDASKNHRAFLLNLAMNAFPENLRIKNEECTNPQLWGITSCDEGSSSGKYWLGYDSNCNVITSDIVNLPYDDYTLTNTIIHEYAHILDGKIDTSDFYNISFYTSDKVSVDGWDFYKVRIDMNNNEQVKQNFFSYAEGWTNPNYPSYRTAYEDFAVSVEMYVTNGIVFRDYIKNKLPLQKKYKWIKENIFNGKEFNTGDKNYKSYISDLSTNGLGMIGIVSAGGMTELRPEYKWDYNLK